jgi:hypothetical protein
MKTAFREFCLFKGEEFGKKQLNGRSIPIPAALNATVRRLSLLDKLTAILYLVVG